MGNLSSENSNYLPMLKLVIIATTSIACILSLSGIVIAGDRYKEVNSKTKFNLVKNKTGQTPSTGTNQVAKFKDLEKLIIDVYKYKNLTSQKNILLFLILTREKMDGGLTLAAPISDITNKYSDVSDLDKRQG